MSRYQHIGGANRASDQRQLDLQTDDNWICRVGCADGVCNGAHPSASGHGAEAWSSMATDKQVRLLRQTPLELKLNTPPRRRPNKCQPN